MSEQGFVVPLPLAGAYAVTGGGHRDERGSTAKLATFGQLSGQGLPTAVEQVLISENAVAGTIRGMHYQADPHGEAKYVWCLSGEVFDVAVDLRPASPTYGHWCSVLLRPAGADEQPQGVYLPTGIAHGYQTLAAGTSLLYLLCGAYVPQAARVLAYDDPRLAITWPLPAQNVSPRDRAGEQWPPAP